MSVPSLYAAVAVLLAATLGAYLIAPGLAVLVGIGGAFALTLIDGHAFRRREAVEEQRERRAAIARRHQKDESWRN